MKTKSTIALITALLLTSVGAYAQPTDNRQTNGRWDTNRTQPTQQRGQIQEQNRNDRNNRNDGNRQQQTRDQRNNDNRQQQTHDQRNNGNRPQQTQEQNRNDRYDGNRQQQTHDQRNNDNRPQQTNNERNRNNGYNNGYNNGRIQNNQSRHTYQRGERLPVDYRGSRGARYEVNDWHSHRNLYAPPSGARWILSVDGDYILASILTGVIYSIIHS